MLTKSIRRGRSNIVVCGIVVLIAGCSGGSDSSGNAGSSAGSGTSSGAGGSAGAQAGGFGGSPGAGVSGYAGGVPVGGEAGSMPQPSGPAAAGDVAWSAPACAGKLARGLGDTILVPCSRGVDNVFERYDLAGEQVEAWPRALIDDGTEAEHEPTAILELPGGDVVVAVRARRNIESGNPGDQSRVRVYRFAPDRAQRWMTEITTFPDGPDEYPLALAVSSGDPDGSVAVTGHANSGGTGNTAIAAVFDSAGSMLWRANGSAGGSGNAVALSDAGEVYVAGASGYAFSLSGPGSFARGALWAFDATGGERWSWFEEPFDFEVGGAVVEDMALGSDGSLAVVGRRIHEDDLVPNPPRTTIELWHRSFEPATGMETSVDVLATTALDGMPWDEVADDAPKVAFARNDTALAYAFAPGRAFGVDLDGQMPWEITGIAAPAGWTFGTLEIAHLWCVSLVEMDIVLRCYHRVDEAAL